MRRIFSIARVTFLLAMRSRAVLFLLLAAFAAVLLLPAALTTDDTLENLLRMLLTYPLALLTFLLTLSSLLIGCSTISREAEERTLPQLLVKPIPRTALWLGKWLALLGLNALVLFPAAALSYGILQHRLAQEARTRPATEITHAKQTLLTAFQPAVETLPDVHAQVEQQYRSLSAAGNLPAGIPPAVIRQSIRQDILTRMYSLPPRHGRNWHIQLATPPADAAVPLFLHIKCDSSALGGSALDLALHVTLGTASTALHPELKSSILQIVPLTTLAAADIRAATGEVTLTLQNNDPDATLFFEPGTGLQLLQVRGTFAANYARAILGIYFRLALLSAIGVTLGTLFHLPVAMFLGIALLLVLRISGFITEAATVDRAEFVYNVAFFGRSETTPPGPLARAAATGIYYIYQASSLVIRPLQADDPRAKLAAARYIPPRTLAHAALIQMGLAPLLLALLSAGILRRREFPAT